MLSGDVTEDFEKSLKNIPKICYPIYDGPKSYPVAVIILKQNLYREYLTITKK